MEARRLEHEMFIVLYNLYVKNAESALPLLCWAHANII